MPRGGKREGSGRPKGSLELKARTSIEVKNRIAQKADDILNAELLEALGAFVVMKANPQTLEYERVTDEAEIVRFIQEHKGANGKIGNSVYILVAKQGNYKSRQYLFDRAFGRPAQAVTVTDEPSNWQKAIKHLISTGNAKNIKEALALLKEAQFAGLSAEDEDKILSASVFE